LKPSVLEALGLVPATRQMIREFSTQDKVHVEKHIDLLDQIDNPTVQVCLYRIFQEALTNIHKHAKATWVLFAVRREAETIHITIRDNGFGFDEQQVIDYTDHRRGMGLHAMKLRCRMIGADLTLDSQPGRGTRLTICLPCPKKEVSQ
jgi:two-component system sensor histidine kinase NreB